MAAALGDADAQRPRARRPDRPRHRRPRQRPRLRQPGRRGWSARSPRCPPGVLRAYRADHRGRAGVRRARAAPRARTAASRSSPPRPTRRRQGLATDVMHRVLLDAREAGCTSDLAAGHRARREALRGARLPQGVRHAAVGAPALTPRAGARSPRRALAVVAVVSPRSPAATARWPPSRRPSSSRSGRSGCRSPPATAARSTSTCRSSTGARASRRSACPRACAWTCARSTAGPSRASRQAATLDVQHVRDRGARRDRRLPARADRA